MTSLAVYLVTGERKKYIFFSYIELHMQDAWRVAFCQRYESEKFSTAP